MLTHAPLQRLRKYHPERQKERFARPSSCIRQLLARQFAVAYSLNRVYDLLKRLHMSWISVRSVSPHADPLKQAEFKKIVQQVKAILPRDIGLDQVHIWSQDEMWVGQRSTQTRLWAREETWPQVVRQ